jgi:hypothetical protein
MELLVVSAIWNISKIWKTYQHDFTNTRT